MNLNISDLQENGIAFTETKQLIACSREQIILSFKTNYKIDLYAEPQVWWKEKEDCVYFNFLTRNEAES